jgi:hypothetical protein
MVVMCVGYEYVMYLLRVFLELSKSLEGAPLASSLGNNVPLPSIVNFII